VEFTLISLFFPQLIKQFDVIFKEARLPLKLTPYVIQATTDSTGFIEAVPDTISIDALKHRDPHYTTLYDFFVRSGCLLVVSNLGCVRTWLCCGHMVVAHSSLSDHVYDRRFGKGAKLEQARRLFCESLAAYSVVCFLLQIKDRHNGNVLLRSDGAIIHIDFGFFLTNYPGGKWLHWEAVPFKLTTEMVDVLGGPRSRLFRYFRSLCIEGYLAARKRHTEILLLVSQTAGAHPVNFSVEESSNFLAPSPSRSESSASIQRVEGLERKNSSDSEGATSPRRLSRQVT
jgi:phosphatidylinositol 4-kinase